MAREDDDREESAELAKLEKAIKTNRTLFFALLVSVAVIISILITSVLVINLQMANRREVPAAEFEELLAELDSHLTHLSAIHNSEAQAYFDFQDSLVEINALYQQENINTLRQLLIERERDTRKLMDLMAEGTTSLANMAPGSRAWTQLYSQKVTAAKTQSQQRQEALRAAMQAPAPDVAESESEAEQ